MNLVIINNPFHYESENLIRVFFPTEKINVTSERNDEENYISISLDYSEKGAEVEISASVCEKKKSEKEFFSLSDKRADDSDNAFFERKTAIMLYNVLCSLTGYASPWGILTGVRPAKLMTNLCKKYGDEEAKAYFINELKVSERKTQLAFNVAKTEEAIINKTKTDSFSLYVSIPFCPTRCSYCSFVSHSNNSAKKLISQYVELLCKEIEETGKIAKRLSLRLESVYIGGGTPTALDPENLKKVTDAISRNFCLSKEIEYTIESGRPDSITKEKLEVIKQSSAGRISINPQTFDNNILEIIGRKHTAEQTEEAMLLAREMGFDNINMDVIAALPTDTVEGFEKTLNKVLSFSPENVTVHTLALKRSSRLVTDEMEKGNADLANEMLEIAASRLSEEGYIPYYMYRQSKCLGNLENVGWAKKNFECEYNVYMMEECHTVIAVGAGAVTKLKNPYNNVIERIFNYKYPYEYINGFDEILNRKKRIEQFYIEAEENNH
ncbi:MAG: coproporphyrinogen dehydrogenase HemZ [Clostridia bacterium]|nr:coproporphyrinogen dehydrogenase HemZ [Clostridia bacterium]